MPIYEANTTSPSDNAYIEIKSGDQSGHVANVTSEKRLKVDAKVSFPVLSPVGLVYEEMNASTGGLARDTVVSAISYDTLYSYTASAGKLLGFHINFDTDNAMYVRVQVDGNDIFFGSTGVLLADLKDNAIFDVKDLQPIGSLGIIQHDNVIHYQPLYPIEFTSSVVISAKTTTNKKFKAGFISIIKG